MPLTVATYNIHHGADRDGTLRLAEIADAIEDADVIGLQEVDVCWGSRSDDVDQAAWLGDRLGMQVTFCPTMTRPGRGNGRTRGYGLAIASRLPIIDRTSTALPAPDGAEPRRLLVARLDAGGTPLLFACTHLDAHAAGTRLAQARRIEEALADDGSTRPTVLAGDLNATRRSAPVRVLTSALLDCWPAAGDGRGPTHEAPRPTRRIDYLLASRDVHPALAWVGDSAASDHRPVFATVTLSSASYFATGRTAKRAVRPGILLPSGTRRSGHCRSGGRTRLG